MSPESKKAINHRENQHLYVLGGTFVALLALVIFSTTGGRQARAGGGLAGVVLPTADGKTQVDLGACPAEKCVRMYISPWCKICRASTPFLKKFAVWSEAQGFPAHIIIGRDTRSEIAAYAAEFGPKVLVDFDGRFPLSGGVPNFVVSDKNGKVLKVVPGVPRLYYEPIRNEYLIEVAQHLELI